MLWAPAPGKRVVPKQPLGPVCLRDPSPSCSQGIREDFKERALRFVFVHRSPQRGPKRSEDQSAARRALVEEPIHALALRAVIGHKWAIIQFEIRASDPG